MKFDTEIKRGRSYSEQNLKFTRSNVMASWLLIPKRETITGCAWSTLSSRITVSPPRVLSPGYLTSVLIFAENFTDLTFLIGLWILIIEMIILTSNSVLFNTSMLLMLSLGQITR